jgi:putative membrane protein
MARHYVRGLVLVFALAWLLLGLHPHDRQDWMLEHVLTVFSGAILCLSRRRYPLSLTAYTLVFAFGLLHTLGAHYTYSLVPYEDWSRDWGGFSVNNTFGWTRNNFDRLVHLAYGLLLVQPVMEWYTPAAGLRGGWRYWFALEFIMATSLIYELIEWMAAEYFGGSLGAAYLGTQGDIWDAHKDMALAITGAAIGLAIIALASARKAAPLHTGGTPPMP